MSKTDRRLLDLIKENCPAEAKIAEMAMIKAMKKVFECEPQSDLAKYYFWLSMNYSTYEIVESANAMLEQNLE